MGWDTAKQFITKTPPLVIERGCLAFITTDVTVEVPTKLHTVLGGMGVTVGASATPPQPVSIADKTITSGCITMERPAGGTSGVSFCYELWGY